MVLSTQNEQPTVWEGEALKLVCKADGAESLLFVNWWHFPWNQTQPEFVAGMDQTGTVQRGASYGEPSNHGHTRLEKLDWATFQLEIPSTSVRDSGTYECRVSERTGAQGGGLSWAQKMSITVKSLGKCHTSPFLNLRTISTFLLQWGAVEFGGVSSCIP